MENKSRYWFKRRRYGWGWTPVTLAGWVTVLVYLTVVVGAAFYLLPEGSGAPSSLAITTFLLVMLAATFLAIGISYAKGPAPRWRWGASEGDNPDEDL